MARASRRAARRRTPRPKAAVATQAAGIGVRESPLTEREWATSPARWPEAIVASPIAAGGEFVQHPGSQALLAVVVDLIGERVRQRGTFED